MGDDEKSATPQRRSRSWIRNLLVTGAVLLVVFTLFHGPILRPLARSLAIHFAAKENLKLDFQIEGSVLGEVTLRNVHATAAGPSAVESIDADLVHADYSLWGLVIHGPPDFLQNVELRSATIILNPGKAPLPKPPKPNEKIRLRTFFPELVHLSNVNLTIRDQPQDFVLRNLNLELDPRHEGALKIDRLQVPNLHTWTDVSATTSYTNRNLFLRNLVFDRQNQFQVVNVDASRIRSRSLGLTIDGSLFGGNLKGSALLREKKSSLATEINFSADRISLGKLAEYFGEPAGFIAGDIENFKTDWRGILKNPKSWSGSVSGRIANIRQKDLALDAVDLKLSMTNGLATVEQAHVIAGNNRVEVTGTATLPDSIDQLGQAPADLKLLVYAPNLKQLTGFLVPPIVGNADADGRIQIKNQTILLRLSVNGSEIGFGKTAAKHLAATIGASKKMPPRKSNEPYYTNLVSTVRAELTDVHYDQYLVDSVRAEVSWQRQRCFLSSRRDYAECE